MAKEFGKKKRATSTDSSSKKRTVKSKSFTKKSGPKSSFSERSGSNPKSFSRNGGEEKPKRTPKPSNRFARDFDAPYTEKASEEKSFSRDRKEAKPKRFSSSKENYKTSKDSGFERSSEKRGEGRSHTKGREDGKSTRFSSTKDTSKTTKDSGFERTPEKRCTKKPFVRNTSEFRPKGSSSSRDNARPSRDAEFDESVGRTEEQDSFSQDDRKERKPRQFNSPRENHNRSKDAAFGGNEVKRGAPGSFSRNRDDVKPRRSGDRERTSSNDRDSKGKFVKKDFLQKPFKKKSDKKPSASSEENTDGMDRLNKYIANTGVCSRREADELIAAGVVSVNGKVITEMGYKVSQTDVVNYGGQTLKREKCVYLLLNKPKDYITTVEDPQGRKTVLNLIGDACRERIYPVGRLDRATTGVLLFTNDGDLTKRLTHPRYGIKKIYHVVLDTPLKKSDFDKITAGFELEDGFIKVDEINYVGTGQDKKEIGIEIHSGKNRIVRRIFEHFGYNVRKLDRVSFAGLTKKDLPRGRWRMLTNRDLQMLKMVAQ